MLLLPTRLLHSYVLLQLSAFSLLTVVMALLTDILPLHLPSSPVLAARSHVRQKTTSQCLMFMFPPYGGPATQ